MVSSNSVYLDNDWKDEYCVECKKKPPIHVAPKYCTEYTQSILFFKGVMRAVTLCSVWGLRVALRFDLTWQNGWLPVAVFLELDTAWCLCRPNTSELILPKRKGFHKPPVECVTDAKTVMVELVSCNGTLLHQTVSQKFWNLCCQAQKWLLDTASLV